MTRRQYKLRLLLPILALVLCLVGLFALEIRWHFNGKLFGLGVLAIIAAACWRTYSFSRKFRAERSQFSPTAREEIDGYVYKATKKSVRNMKICLAWLIICIPLTWHQFETESLYTRVVFYLVWASFVAYVLYLLRHFRRQQNRYERGESL